MDDFEEMHEQGSDVIITAVVGTIVFIVILVIIICILASQGAI